MPTCKFCNQSDLEWYQDAQDKWHLGIKLDINNFRQHKCSPPQNEEKTKIPFPNRRGWIKYECECGYKIWLSKKHYPTVGSIMDCEWCNKEIRKS